MLGLCQNYSLMFAIEIVIVVIKDALNMSF